jgi:hypothetical protein
MIPMCQHQLCGFPSARKARTDGLVERDAGENGGLFARLNLTGGCERDGSWIVSHASLGVDISRFSVPQQKDSAAVGFFEQRQIFSLLQAIKLHRRLEARQS